MALRSPACVPACTTTGAWLETGARSRVHQSSAFGRHRSSTCSAFAHFEQLRFPYSCSTPVAVHISQDLLSFRREGCTPRLRSQETIRKQLRGRRQLTCAKNQQLQSIACHAKATPERVVVAGGSKQKPPSVEVEKLFPGLEPEERLLAGRKPSAEKLEVGRSGKKGASEEGSGRTWSDRSYGAASSILDADKDESPMATVDLNDVHNFEVKGSGVSEGHTLLERGTRLINTATKGTRWRDVRSTREAEHTQGIASSRSSALESRAPGTSLDAIFGKSEPGKGRQKLRFTRNPQPDVIAGSIDNEDAEMPVRSSPLSTIARPLPRGQFGKSGGRLRRSPLSGLLAGYETADESEMADTSATLAAGPEWVVEPCPVCHGTATLVCDVCDSGWPPGACPACKGVGYKTCTHCHGSGTTYRQTKRSQPPKTPAPSKVPAQSTSAVNEPLEEEGPSLLEAYRIIKNERRMQSASSGANGRAAANGTPAKTHWLVGRPKSPEHRAKISRAMQGKPRSPLTSSHRKKLSDLRREFFEEPGARERWSELAKKFWAPRKRVMHCSYCGLEGHNSRFCPERGFVKSTNKPCPICGQPGHGRGGSCPKRGMVRIPFRCKKCGEYGHEAGQCPNSAAFPGRTLCEICGLPDHRVRECPERPKELIIQRCSICGQPGHNRKRCPQRTDAG